MDYEQYISGILDRAESGNGLDESDAAALRDYLSRTAPASEGYIRAVDVLTQRGMFGDRATKDNPYIPGMNSPKPPGEMYFNSLGDPDPALHATLGQAPPGQQPAPPPKQPSLGPRPDAPTYDFTMPGMDQKAIDDRELEDFLTNGPAGYSFSGLPPANIPFIKEHPDIMANIMSDYYGGGPATAEFMKPYLQSADSLVGMGVLGGGGDDLTHGEPSPVLAMQQIEDVARVMQQPGTQFVDPGALYQDIFTRAGNTNMDGMPGRNGGDMGIEEQIDVTNTALLQASPFMTNDAAGVLGGKLEQAKRQYLTLLATGKTTMTYPAFLKDIGAGEWIR